MDGAVGITPATEQSTAAAQSQSKPVTASGVVVVVPNATPGFEKHGSSGAQTLNGSAAVVNCHIPGGGSADSSQPAVTLVNGPVSVTKEGAAALSAAPSTIIRTTLSAQNAATSSVIASQPSGKTVPTVTLVRPPMQTSTNTSQSAVNPITVLTSSPPVSVTSTTGSLVSKTDSAKTVMITGAHVVTSTVATGTTVRSPTVLQNIRTSVPSTIAATPAGGIRAIATQVLAPRLTQPQQNATNVQNIQLPPGKLTVKFKSNLKFSEFIFNLRVVAAM